MKFMRRRNLRMFAVAALLPFVVIAPAAQTRPAPARISSADQATIQQVTRLLREFLAAVPKSDRQMFENFFADDVIYTRAVGVTVTKTDIISNVDVRSTSEPKATYAARPARPARSPSRRFRSVPPVRGRTRASRSTPAREPRSIPRRVPSRQGQVDPRPNGIRSKRCRGRERT